MAVDPNPRPVQLTAYWARIVWMLILGGAGAFEVYGQFIRKGPDDTLSETTRWLWRTDTPAGAWAFRIFWAAFATWFGPHILRISAQHQDPPST